MDVVFNKRSCMEERTKVIDIKKEKSAILCNQFETDLPNMTQESILFEIKNKDPIEKCYICLELQEYDAQKQITDYDRASNLEIQKNLHKQNNII
mmetsp:Transcript_31089/g.41115  ORF Transcript_31089/g.41115 Transcript_31089/m.41115 type:complete len:95 (-) Transcript_31089:99-383(-)